MGINIRSLILFLPIITISTSAYAQNLGCGDVYKNAVRNISIETKDRTSKSFYFNLYCEKSGSTKDFTASASVGFPIEGIPLEISGDGHWSETELKDFCKQGVEQRFYQSNDLSFGSFVVSDALASFNECLALEKKDLIVTHSESAPTGVTIFGRFQTTQLNLAILGMLYDETVVECSSTSLSDDGKEIKIDRSQSFSNIKQNFSISCKRKPKIEGDRTYYPPASLTLATTQGPYTVRLRSDTNLGFNLASEAKAAYDSAVTERNNAIAAMNNALAQLAEANRKLNNPSVTWHKWGTGEYDKSIFRPRLDPRWGDGQNPAQYVKKLCGDKKAFYKVLHDQPGDCCGYTEYAAICLSQ